MYSGRRLAIDKFLKLDDDDNPFEKLLNRRISDEIMDSMEVNMTLQEMTKALNEDMKGTSVPGVDGFSVIFIRKFWDSLGALVRNAVNKCKSKNKLTSTLRTDIFKLLRKGDLNPILAGNFCPISLLSDFYKIASCVITNII